jgi:hypothetical protein
MEMVMIWISVHKNLVYGIIAIGLWVVANYIYFRRDIAAYRARRRPHVWEVDMKSRKVVRGKSNLR